MENSGNFVKLSPNQGTLHFCQTGDIKKKESRGEGNEAKFKKRKETEIQL